MAVLVIFFSINNSYFSPHKMDTVEAASIVVGGGVVITADLVIKLVCTLAAAGLSVGLIVEWQDMDLETLLEDFHDWCQDNYELLKEYIAAMPDLQTWVLSDVWVVVDTSASGSPQPSPSPDSDEQEETLPSTGNSNTGVSSDYDFEDLLINHRGFTNAFKITVASLATGVSLTSILTPLSILNEYGEWVDSDGIEQFSCFCFAIGLLLFIHLLMAVFDLIDCYQYRRKLPSLLAEEILKRTNGQA